ncbi:hypothetical protein L2748_21295 [Shewanella sairae]|nr:hypothetical protein [Shewanella sairae]MCL1132221.1 hypothetical protein [Shewanella sairae]
MTDIKSTLFGEFMSKSEIIAHATIGLLCGYPECCIKYCLLRRRDTVVPLHAYSDCGVVLCPECTAKPDITDTIQSRRLLSTPYPYHIGDLADQPVSDAVRCQADIIARELMDLFKSGAEQ